MRITIPRSLVPAIKEVGQSLGIDDPALITAHMLLDYLRISKGACPVRNVEQATAQTSDLASDLASLLG